MMIRKLVGAVLLLLAVGPAWAAEAYSIKTVESPPPKELAEAVRKELGDRCVQLTNEQGDLLVEVWFRKEVPAKATEAQVQNGLTYREIPETTVLGAFRLPKPYMDYRKQKLAAGVYTLRFALQPQNGDHMGTAPYGEFVLTSPAADDKKPDVMEPKSLHEMSAKSTESHPGVILLFPGKGATAEPKLVNKGDGHWVLLYTQDVKVGDKKVTIPLGLTLVGFSTAA